MEVVKKIYEMKAISLKARQNGKIIAFVPTMGYFHEGHLSLMREGRRRGDLLIVSLFVNPTQFGPSEDFKKYPRDFQRDHKMAEEAGVDFLFCPEVEEMYPPDHQTIVRVEKLTKGLCGRSRPNHFQGVTTVVNMLFNIVMPQIAIFGEKDFQQLVTVRQMVKDLYMDVEIIGMPTVREQDGLAMSSRNTYLNPKERKAATLLYQSLKKAEQLVIHGEKSVEKIINEMKKILTSDPLVSLDYIQICDTHTLEDVSSIDRGVVIALAAFVGQTRLIDNILIRK